MGYISLLIGITLIGIVAYFGFSAYTPSAVIPQSTGQNIAVNLPLEKTYLTINKKIIQIDVATTPEQHTNGLSGRKSLAKDTGMLFVFPQPEMPGFWMKDMHFPIDIVWIDQNNTVVGTTENLIPESYPQKFFPPSPILRVLEVPAGFVKQYNVKKGDVVNTSNFRN